MDYLKMPSTKSKPQQRPTALDVVQKHVKKFDALFATDRNCLEQLCSKYMDRNLIRCSNCDSADIARDYGERFGKCRQCRKRVHITAGTFFNKIRSPRPWLLAIWLIENGVEFNSSHLQKVAGVAYSTAWSILKKISYVAHCFLEDFQSVIEVPTADLIQTFFKRSSLTPAAEHPQFEQFAMETACFASGTAASAGLSTCTSSPQATVPMSSSTGAQTFDPQIAAMSGQSPCAETYSLTDEDKVAWELLSEAPIHFDALAKLVAPSMNVPALSLVLLNLELEGYVMKKGCSYARFDPSVTHSRQISVNAQSMNATVSSSVSSSISSIGTKAKKTKKQRKKLANFVEFVSGRCHGIARKYVGLYSAYYWCLKDKKRWPKMSLLDVCAGASAVKADDIRAFVTPLIVKVAV